MLYSRAAFCLALTLSAPTFAQTGNPENPPPPPPNEINPVTLFSVYSQYLTVRGNFERQLNEARLVDARLRLQQAYSSQNLVEAQRYTFTINGLENERLHLQTQDVARQRDLLMVEEKSKLLQGIAVGKLDYIWWHAWDYFTNRLIFPEDLYLVMAKVAVVLPAQQFAISTELSFPPAPHDFLGGNVGNLFDFVRYNHFNIVPATPAHVAMLDAMQALQKLHADRVVKIEAACEQLRLGTYRLWDIVP